MAYVVPVPSDIKGSFPEFATVDDAIINDALMEAGLAVDTTWPESAFNLAYKLYTAHLLTVGGHGTSASSLVFSGSPAGLKRRKSGDTEEEFFQAPGTGGGAAVNLDAWLQQTGYGQRFAILRRRFFGGPMMLVPSPAFVCGPYGYPFG